MQASPELHPPPVQLIFDNRAALSAYGIDNPTYTPPGAIAGHYLGQYKWDSLRTSKILARFGYLKEAEEEFDTLMSVQDPVTGFIPNQARHVKRPAWKELEWATFNSDFTSSYSQPAMEAESALELYDGFVLQGEAGNARDFLTKNYDKLDLAYDYWRTYRQLSPANPLLFVTHSNETGRDSCPVFDSFKHRLPRNGIDTTWVVNSINPALDYLSSVNNAWKNKRQNWDPEKIRNNFEVVDVMFNCLYQKNLLAMARISEIVGNEEKSQLYSQLADKVEQAIIEQLWNPLARDGKGAFYPIHKRVHVEEDVAANLYPLLLPNLPPKHLAACLEQLLGDFNTPYPIPSVSVHSRNFDPHYKEKGIMWRGPVWQWINADLREALFMQSLRDGLSPDLKRLCLDLSEWIEDSSEQLVTGSPHENHDPYTGEGFRTPHFAGAASGWRLPKAAIVIL